MRHEQNNDSHLFGEDRISNRTANDGKTVLKKQLKRDQVIAFFVDLPPCSVGMEACGSSHHGARKLGGLEHTVKRMAPQFVMP